MKQLDIYVIRGRQGVCLINDRGSGFLAAYKLYKRFSPPHGVHKFCVFHIRKNCMAHAGCKTKGFGEIIRRASYARTRIDFEDAMKALKSKKLKAFEYMKAIPLN